MDSVRRAIDVAAAIAVVAMLTMLVRPGSKGPQMVAAIGTAFTQAAQGTIGATLAPDDQIPGATGSASSSTGTAAGAAIGALGQAGPGAAYSPSSYNVPGGSHLTRSYW